MKKNTKWELSSKHEEVSIAFLPSNIMMITTFNRSLWSNHAYFRRWEIFLYVYIHWNDNSLAMHNFNVAFIRLLFNCWLMTFVNRLIWIQLKSYSDIVFRAQLKEQCKSSPDFVCNLQFYMTLFFIMYQCAISNQQNNAKQKKNNTKQWQRQSNNKKECCAWY